jgi:hypothetical protein
MNFNLPNDRIISAFLIFGSVLLGLYSIFIKMSYIFLLIAVFILIPSLLWTFYYGKSKITLSTGAASNGKRTLKITYVLFFSVVTAIILILYWNDFDYLRPLIFFGLLISLVMICVFQIIFWKLVSVKFIFIEIIVIATIIITSQVLLFPEVIYSDGWFHQAFISIILDTGFIPTYSQYANLPGYHILVTDTLIITGMDFKLASLISISIIQVIICILFTYLISNILIKNNKLALLSSLIVALGNIQVMMNVSIVPNTLAACFFIIIIFICIKATSDGIKIPWTVLILVFSVALVITHALASAMVLVVITGFVLAEIVHYKKNLTSNPLNNFVTRYLLIIACISISWWAYQSDQISVLRDLIFTEFSLNQVSLIRVSIFGIIANRIGMLLFFSIALIGIFYSLSKSGTKHLKMFIFGAVGIAAIGILPSLFGMDILGSRFWYFGQIMMAIPMSITFFIILSNGKQLRVAFIIILMVFLAITQIMIPPGSIDNPLHIESGTTLALSSSELNNIGFIRAVGEGNYSVDAYTYSCFWRLDSNIFNAELLLLTKNDTAYMPNVLVIREVDGQRSQSQSTFSKWGYSMTYVNDMSYTLTK